jgi:hypothetical protein
MENKQNTNSSVKFDDIYNNISNKINSNNNDFDNETIEDLITDVIEQKKIRKIKSKFYRNLF